MNLGVMIGIVLLGGAAAVARFAVVLWLPVRRRLPISWGVVVANTVGSAVAGLAIGLYVENKIPGPVFLLLSIGVAGGLSTFSTMMGESTGLLRVGRPRVAVGNIVVNVFVGLAAAVLAFWAATTL